MDSAPWLSLGILKSGHYTSSYSSQSHSSCSRHHPLPTSLEPQLTHFFSSSHIFSIPDSKVFLTCIYTCSDISHLKSKKFHSLNPCFPLTNAFFFTLIFFSVKMLKDLSELNVFISPSPICSSFYHSFVSAITIPLKHFSLRIIMIVKSNGHFSFYLTCFLFGIQHN